MGNVFPRDFWPPDFFQRKSPVGGWTGWWPTVTPGSRSDLLHPSESVEIPKIPLKVVPLTPGGQAEWTLNIIPALPEFFGAYSARWHLQ